MKVTPKFAAKFLKSHHGGSKIFENSKISIIVSEYVLLMDRFIPVPRFLFSRGRTVDFVMFMSRSFVRLTVACSLVDRSLARSRACLLACVLASSLVRALVIHDCSTAPRRKPG